MLKLLKLLALFGILALIGCSNGNGPQGTPGPTPSPTPSGTPQNVVITVTPPSGFTGFIGTTQTLQFAASVTGTANQTVNWSVNGTAGGSSAVGTINGSGIFTAPNQVPNPQRVLVAATSQADTTKSASITVFVSRIPPSGSWQRTGPTGGTITAFAEDTNHPGTVYAGVDLGGQGALWKSTDFGGAWAPLVTNSFMDSRAAFDIAVPASGGGNIIYICTGFFASSQDGGATWTEKTTPAPSRAMAVDPQNRATIYLSAPGTGVLKSLDSGATWTLLPGSPVITSGSATAILHNPLQVDLARSSTVYYGTDHGMFVSQDGGGTWTQSTNGFASGDMAIRDVAGDPANTSAVFALAGSPTSVVTLYESTDRGNSWTLLSSGLDVERVVPDQVNASILYLSGLQFHAVYKSTDSGHTFVPSDSGMPSGSSGGGIIITGPTGILMPLAGQANTFLSSIGGLGVFRSADAAQSWSFSSTGISSWQGHAIAFDPQHPATLYLGASQGVFKSNDSGISWTEIQAQGSLTLAVDPFASNHLLAELGGNGLFESHDGGTTWAAVNNLPPVPNGGIALITAIAFSPKVQGTVFISTQGTANVGVVRSTDGGANYTITNAGLTNLRVTSAVAVNPQTPAMLFAGTIAGVFKSIDNGNSWTLSTTRPATVISFDAKVTPPTIYINGAKSIDLGNTWTAMPPGIGAVIVDPSTPNSIFAFAQGPISPTEPQWSPDGGTTFFPMNAGLGGSNMFFGFGGQAVAVAPGTPQTLFVGSLTNSILRFVVGP